MKHTYLAIQCEACRAENLVYYAGPDVMQIGANTPTGFEWVCGRCGQARRYLRKALHPVQTDSAPPAEWKNPF